MIGHTIRHYKVLEKVGEGGMGEVYLAEDTSLERKVALKFLPEYLQQDDVAHTRFLREAKSAAAIDHAYICNIFEISQSDDGRDFIAMEYVEGQTLTDKLNAGRVPLNQALQIASEVAEALEAAHQEGIVHRDLKPSNIMLTVGGHVKVMDFGLAKKLVDKEKLGGMTATLTREGTTLGTLNYMSPEQLRSQPVDTRSDIFSFGVVLYEILTGIHPFKKETQPDTINAIFNEDWPALSQHTEGIPIILQHTLRKMLAKAPAQRYQSIHEVRTNLNELLQPTGSVSTIGATTVPGAKRLRWTLALLPLLILAVWVGWWLFRGEVSSVVPGEITSLAVLPLNNLMNDPGQEYFVEGMQEELITELSQIRALRVISRTSTIQYKKTEKSLPKIAEELDVDALVEGSVLRSEDMVRVNLQLVAVDPERHLWSRRFDRELSDILTLYSEVAQAVARQIRVAVSPEEQLRLTNTRKVNPKAYEAYLYGRYCFTNKFSPQGARESIEHFNRAAAEDPSFAPGYAALANSYSFLAVMGEGEFTELEEKARVALSKALELDDSLALAHSVTASFRALNWDWAGGEIEIRRALELDPSSADIHHHYGVFHLLPTGRFDEAARELQKAIDLEPHNPHHRSILGWIYICKKEYEQAIRQLESVLEIDPHYHHALRHLGLALALTGQHSEAIAAVNKVVSQDSEDVSLMFLAFVYALSDQKELAQELLKELNERSEERFVFYATRAYIHAALGEPEMAFSLLEESFRRNESSLIWLNVHPLLDSLRSDPRFEALVRRMNLEP